jgi:hypothetical protein
MRIAGARASRLVVVAVAFAAAFGCGNKKPVAPPVARAHFAVPACTSPLSKDPMEVTILQREGAGLVLRMNYLGGCTQHRFDACWYLAGDDDPVVVIGHDAHGDACTSWFERVIEFDLSGLPEGITRGRAPAAIVRLETPARR